MSIYVRELLFDLDKLDIITKCDILVGIQKLYTTGQIQYGQVHVLNRYLEGYSLDEICSDHGLDVEESRAVREDLAQLLSLLEDSIKYTDDIIIQQGLRIYPKYKKRAEELRNKCIRLSKEL